MDLPIIIISDEPSVRDDYLTSCLKQHQVTADHPDVIYLSDKLGIESVKKIAGHLSWKPTLSNKRIVIVNPADALTRDAQHGLLKILEEPSDNAVIILGVDQEESLLPTIRSRCEVKYLQKEDLLVQDVSYLKSLLEKDIPSRLEALEQIDDRKKIVQDLLIFYQSLLREGKTGSLTVKLLLEAEKWVKQNVSAKAVSDYIMIRLPKI